MEKEKKNVLLTFLELVTQEGLLKDGIEIHKKRIFELMDKIEKNWVGDKQIFIQLERAIIDTLELTQHKYFDYGMLACVIDENYALDYDPFKRLAE